MVSEGGKIYASGQVQWGCRVHLQCTPLHASLWREIGLDFELLRQNKMSFGSLNESKIFGFNRSVAKCYPEVQPQMFTLSVYQTFTKPFYILRRAFSQLYKGGKNYHNCGHQFSFGFVQPLVPVLSWYKAHQCWCSIACGGIINDRHRSTLTINCKTRSSSCHNLTRKSIFQPKRSFVDEKYLKSD